APRPRAPAPLGRGQALVTGRGQESPVFAPLPIVAQGIFGFPHFPEPLRPPLCPPPRRSPRSGPGRCHPSPAKALTARSPLPAAQHRPRPALTCHRPQILTPQREQSSRRSPHNGLTSGHFREGVQRASRSSFRLPISEVDSADVS